mgnify:FL=1
MPLRRIARPLLAAWFIGDAVDALTHPQAHVEMARTPANNLLEKVGMEPLSDSALRSLVRLQGGAMVVLSLGLALGKAPRTCGLGLAAMYVPPAILSAPVGKGKAAKAQQGTQFVRKLGAVGAALLVAADTDGKPSMAYRVNKAKVERAEQRLKAAPTA